MLPPKLIHLPFTEANWRLKLGLKSVSLEDWIEIDEEFATYLTTKAELLQTYYSKVFDSLPSSAVAQREVLDLLLAHLLSYFPQYYHRQGDRIKNLITQQVWHLSDFDANPLDLAGRLVQEDLCLLQSSPEGYTLTAGSVCLPFHWWFPDKLGKPIAQIHKPVPKYAEKLEHPINNFFDRLRLDRPGYRLNWALVNTPRLCLPLHDGPESLDDSMTVDNIGQKLWIRVERQTLRRLGQSQNILFGIRTYLYPLSVLENNLTMASNFLAEIQKMPHTMQQYKNIISLRDTLTDYLQFLLVRPGVTFHQ
jgi:hypothetical protein